MSTDDRGPPSTNGNGDFRDHRGRFLAGHPHSRGRRSRPSAWCIAEQKAEEAGVDLEEALWQVILSMIQKAQAGDVAAAKLVLDALTIGLAEELDARLRLLEAQR